MEIDLERWKTTPPWRDVTFWIVLAFTIPLILPLIADAWSTRVFPTGEQIGGAFMPLTAWLVLHGYVRHGAVKAAGTEAAAVAPEVARQHTIFPETDPDAAEFATTSVDDVTTDPAFAEARDAEGEV